MDVKLEARGDTNTWCVHDAKNDNHTGVLVYKGDEAWELELEGPDGDMKHRFEAPDFRAAEAVVREIMKQAVPVLTEELGIDQENLEGYAGANLEILYKLARSGGMVATYIKVLAITLGEKIGEAAKNEEAKALLIKAVHEYIGTAVAKSSEPKKVSKHAGAIEEIIAGISEAIKAAEGKMEIEGVAIMSGEELKALITGGEFTPPEPVKPPKPQKH